jgi:hypothetical protein
MAREVSSISQIKSNILRPALTSQYIVQIPIPSELDRTSRDALTRILGADQEKLNLLCAETSLPGSSLLTSEAVDDRTGVTERHAYRRNYGQQIDLTFYVDAEKYLPITFFETWIAIIAGEGLQVQNTRNSNYNFRFRYPNEYQAKQGLKIKKFERDYYSQRRKSNPLEDIVNIIAGTDLGTTVTTKSGPDIEYEFLNAFPISINSMPISYDTSQLLKCTVSFAYTRYIVNKVTLGRIGELGDGPTPSAGENALSSLFESAKQSLINDKSAPVFAEPKTFLEKFGSGRTLPDRINSDIA